MMLIYVRAVKNRAIRFESDQDTHCVVLVCSTDCGQIGAVSVTKEQSAGTETCQVTAAIITPNKPAGLVGPCHHCGKVWGMVISQNPWLTETLR
jgi:hypothetical protein